MASALLGLGLNPGDKVAILSKNCAEWMLADVAISMAGLVSVPIYPTANVIWLPALLVLHGCPQCFIIAFDRHITGKH